RMNARLGEAVGLDPKDMRLIRSNLYRLTEPANFLWSAGIEDTFIAEPWPPTGRMLDEYELTGHYLRYKEDIGLLAGLGVRVVRYGIPWYKVNPAAGKWDWDWADAPLEQLLEAGIEPVVDLVHYGVPAWLQGAFLAPDFPARMAEYAARVAERFKGRIRAYTPLNEPRITAWYCGKLGWWPPYRRGWRGFVEVMLAVGRGIVLTVEALQSVDDDIAFVHVDATDIFETQDASLEPEVHRRQEIVFLALDLISGRINQEHSLYRWLLRQGATVDGLAWFEARAVDLAVIGINLYPMYSPKVLARTARGLRIRMPYTTTGIIERLSQLYWDRYHAPLVITETAAMGDVERRQEWLDASVAAVRNVRESGIPLVGYTWWPALGIVTWAYRQGTLPREQYLKTMGLWDLDPEPGANMRRMETPLVNSFQ